MPASVLTVMNSAGLGERIAALLLQVQDAPAVDRITRDVDGRAREREHPDRRDAQDRELLRQDARLGAARAAPVVVPPVGDGRQSERPRPVLHQRVDADAATMHRMPGPQKPQRQPSAATNRATTSEGEPFAHRMRRAPDAVEAAALAVAEPVRSATRRPTGAPKPWNQPFSAHSATDTPERPSRSPCRC